MSTESYQTIRPGTIVAGKYQVQRMLGEGGVGVVYAARHMRLDRDVALKFLKLGRDAVSQRAELFAHEARATFDIVDAGRESSQRKIKRKPTGTVRTQLRAEPDVGF